MATTTESDEVEIWVDVRTSPVWSCAARLLPTRSSAIYDAYVIERRMYIAWQLWYAALKCQPAGRVQALSSSPQVFPSKSSLRRWCHVRPALFRLACNGSSHKSHKAGGIGRLGAVLMALAMQTSSRRRGCDSISIDLPVPRVLADVWVTASCRLTDVTERHQQQQQQQRRWQWSAGR